MGAGATIKPLKKSLFFWGVPYSKGYGIAFQAMNWQTVKAEKKEKIEKDMDKLARKIGKVGMLEAGIKTRFIFRMMANMHRSGFDASPIEKQYWQDMGWLDKKSPWNKG